MTTGTTSAPQITRLGHACVLIASRDARVLVDPGSFTQLPADLGRVDAVAITHGHYDHVSVDLVSTVLRDNPEAVVIAPPSIDLDETSDERVLRVKTGDVVRVGAVDIAIVGGVHALIHADVPQIENVGYLFVDDAILHPGDEFIVPDEPVTTLCTPVSGPWQSLEDAVDYVRAVGPLVVVPIHEGMLARPQVYIDYLEKLKPKGSTVLVPVIGVPAALPLPGHGAVEP